MMLITFRTLFWVFNAPLFVKKKLSNFKKMVIFLIYSPPIYRKNKPQTRIQAEWQAIKLRFFL
ncbi:hypothetical protein BG55_15465 [Erwinia mallotivora]|uniref:Uncharacterized protein n=1 Tax=Erwinia mallotivora TaxID=69222 RepID=A0A014LYW2_9GAMM|nr:hypothetical protein BG55_15465 [Erwinia mallotivora]